MRLILPGHTPYVAATATANLLTREAVRQVLRFGQDSVTVNLGNHRPNLAYSVHRMKKATSSVSEILEYFPDQTKLPGCTLIFVDSRPIGQLVLSLLRRHFIPSLRYKIQIYHAFRSDYAKEILASGFEKDGGFEVMICTEAMTLVSACYTNRMRIHDLV
jgi:superfamily II DNA helicase RecQ